MAVVSINAESLIKISSSAIANADYGRMYEIAEVVSKDPALIEKFDRDPVAAAKAINGFEPPAGFHMHIVDRDNKYHPSEDDALGQISAASEQEKWARIEARAGYGGVACVICLWCK